MKKKSQMEIMGLVIIVILVTLGMFFVVRFMVGKQPSDIRTSYVKTEMAANILNSMLKTSSKDCLGMTVTQLLQDCAVNHEIEASQIMCEDGKYSCEYVLEIIKTIFNETLVKWGDQSFHLKAYMQDNEEGIILEYKNKGCPGEKETKHQPIPTQTGTLIIRVEVC